MEEVDFVLSVDAQSFPRSAPKPSLNRILQAVIGFLIRSHLLTAILVLAVFPLFFKIPLPDIPGFLYDESIMDYSDA